MYADSVDSFKSDYSRYSETELDLLSKSSPLCANINTYSADEV